MFAVLKNRQQVIVLDPHNTPGSWGKAQVIGGGRDFESIGQFMQQMGQTLSQRYNQRARGVSQFEPLTVATDEMPAIVAALGRRVDDVWREWLREGRKVGLFFVVSTQSTRVRTLGIRGEGDLLENFNYVLVLGKLAVNQYPDLVRQMNRPSVFAYRARYMPCHYSIRNTILTSWRNRPTDFLFAPPPSEFADPNELTAATRAAYMSFSSRAIQPSCR